MMHCFDTTDSVIRKFILLKGQKSEIGIEIQACRTWIYQFVLSDSDAWIGGPINGD